MNQNLKQISLVVRDYDEAIDYYTNTLHFKLIEDTALSETKRWVVVKPNGQSDFSLLLAKASNETQASRIGNQTGGRVFLFLHTDNFARDYKNLLHHNVKIIRERTEEVFGTVAVFEDMYGNLWDLIEAKEKKPSLYYMTAILKVKDPSTIDQAIEALNILKEATLKEAGNISYDLQQSKDDPMSFVIWECFEDEAAFKAHSTSAHINAFRAKALVDIVTGISSQKL